MEDSPSILVGKRLKAFRKDQGYTLRDLSKISGVSVNTISLIEREKTSPTIATLHKLATALSVGISDFCGDTSSKQIVFTRRDQRRQARYGSIFMGHLGEGLSNQTISPAVLTFDPGADSGAEPMMHSGHELAFCLNGRIQYEINGEQYMLEPGDCLLFEAHLPHRWRNANDNASQALIIVDTSNGSEINYPIK